MQVKICGITSLKDALAALQAGSDLLGFNFYPRSPRFVTPEQCRWLVQALKSHPQGNSLRLVGVFVNATPAEVQQILAFCHLDLAQLSGDEPPETLYSLAGRAFKVLRSTDLIALEADLQHYSPCPNPPAYLLDASRPGQYGGTGQMANWQVAAHLAQEHPVLLAGGLTPANVAQAVRCVRPWGVDVASGVERAPGQKDPVQMTAFIRTARQTWQEMLSRVPYSLSKGGL